MEGVATLSEIREKWSLEDVLHANHLLNIKAENAHRQRKAIDRKKK